MTFDPKQVDALVVMGMADLEAEDFSPEFRELIEQIDFSTHDEIAAADGPAPVSEGYGVGVAVINFGQ
jgi:hypothetical protein